MIIFYLDHHYLYKKVCLKKNCTIVNLITESSIIQYIMYIDVFQFDCIFLHAVSFLVSLSLYVYTFIVILLKTIQLVKTIDGLNPASFPAI